MENKKDEKKRMKTYTFHSKLVKKRRYTVAGILSEDGKTLSIGSAIFCSTKKDTFTKKRGRAIAMGRAAKNPIVEIPVESTEGLGKFFNSKASILPIKEQIEFYSRAEDFFSPNELD